MNKCEYSFCQVRKTHTGPHWLWLDYHWSIANSDLLVSCLAHCKAFDHMQAEVALVAYYQVEHMRLHEKRGQMQSQQLDPAPYSLLGPGFGDPSVRAKHLLAEIVRQCEANDQRWIERRRMALAQTLWGESEVAS